MKDTVTQALFSEYPALSVGVPHLPLGGFPTPITRLRAVGESTGLEHLYVKRDDLAGEVYGGNKVRKLETLLGEVRQAGWKGILTFGCVGSNHIVATAIYGRKIGVPVTCLLLPCPPNSTLRRNLYLSHQYGATLVHCEIDTFLKYKSQILQEQRLIFRRAHGGSPRIIPFGGTSQLGTAGFVNAALELKQQVCAGQIPEPDFLYVPLASMGTVAGLVLGLKVAGLSTRVVAVRVVDLRFNMERALLECVRETNAMLHDIDPSFPMVDLGELNFEVRHEFCGEGYGLMTVEGLAAMRLLAEQESIELEGTYTSKTFAALLHDVRTGKLRDRTTLFWHTANSKDMSPLMSELDYRALPPDFHRYF